MSKEASSSSGISVWSLLVVVLITLKLLGKITWSWWWVTFPFWGGFAVFIAILFSAGLFVGLAAVTCAIFERKRR